MSKNKISEYDGFYLPPFLKEETPESKANVERLTKEMEDISIRLHKAAEERKNNH